jgi:peptide deformylase
MIITNIDELRKQNTNASLEEAEEIIKRLERELKDSPINGVGLAAPQIGIHKNVVIIRTEEDKLDLVNPIIVDKRNGFIFKDEGCLSFPGKKANTFRYKEVFIKDDIHPDGFVAVGMTAVVILHELGHLVGNLLIDNDVGKVGRNDPCPCGALKEGRPIKFKNCHGN